MDWKNESEIGTTWNIESQQATRDLSNAFHLIGSAIFLTPVHFCPAQREARIYTLTAASMSSNS